MWPEANDLGKKEMLPFSFLNINLTSVFHKPNLTSLFFPYNIYSKNFQTAVAKTSQPLNGNL